MNSEFQIILSKISEINTILWSNVEINFKPLQIVTLFVISNLNSFFHYVMLLLFQDFLTLPICAFLSLQLLTFHACLHHLLYFGLYLKELVFSNLWFACTPPPPPSPDCDFWNCSSMNLFSSHCYTYSFPSWLFFDVQINLVLWRKNTNIKKELC